MNTKYQSIILMGQAGSGKGTQAQLLAEKLQYTIFSIGDKAREIAAKDTPLGRHIANVHTTAWIPEWLASYLMTRALLEEFSESGLVFESVARKPEEAVKLHEMHQALERPYIVIHLEVDESVVLERLHTRNRPGYDVEEKIQMRMKAFRDETMRSIDYFSEQGVLRVVNADQSMEDTCKDILREISK